MNPLPRFTWWTLLPLLLVLGCAIGSRVWYVAICTDNGERAPALLVQGPPPPSHFPEAQAFRGRTPPTRLDNLVANLAELQWFGCLPPLAEKEEPTAHQAPGYPLLLSVLVYWSDSADMLMRWLQCALGSLTAGCYFFFARRAFHSTVVAALAGLFCAFHPFWIINSAELNDGVLVSFLVAASLALGARGSQDGGAFTSLGFGLALAGVGLTRAALLPFAIVALLWFLWQCRRIPFGWFASLLALIGFANGVAPWGIRNYFEFDRPIPVATSAYLHLWMGNNPHATGSTLNEPALRLTLSEDRLKTLLEEPNQAKRYNQLANECWQEVQDHPTETLSRRINAALVFLLGERWFKQRQLGWMQEKTEGITAPPDWMHDHAETILQATLLSMFALALLGWRWSYAWRRYGRLATVAMLCVPLPYVLSHAEQLSGPRLPLDGVMLCYAAFALASLIPGLVHSPLRNREAQPREGEAPAEPLGR
jgi:4-amino-4-deoxy-L-arabinose transferase-like glycosyltransferase